MDRPEQGHDRRNRATSSGRAFRSQPLPGSLGDQRTDSLASIPDTAERLVLATGRYIGKGFDDSRLDTLFLALPVSWKGTLIQYSGRLHRHRPAKTNVRIYDYVDRRS